MSTSHDHARRAVARRPRTPARLRRTHLLHLRRPPAPAIADELRHLVFTRGYDLPHQPDGNDDDPLRTLQLVAETCPPDIVQGRQYHTPQCRTEAINTAKPTPGAADVIRAARDSGRRTAIVSNNSESAVRGYLSRHGLSPNVNYISARTDDMDRRLRPEPDLVQRALSILDVGAGNAVLLGDSTADIQAGNAAAVTVIGYANTPGKHLRLSTAGSRAVISDLGYLVAALRASGLSHRS